MPVGSEQRRERRREWMQNTIVDAAKPRLLRYGIRATTMEEIARDADLSTASLYNYFQDKEELYAKVVDHVLATDREYLDAAFDQGKSAVEELIDIGKAYLSFGIDHPGYFQMVAQPDTFGPVDEMLRERIAERVDELVDRVAAVIGRGRDNGELFEGLDTKDTAVFLHGAWNGLLALSLRKDKLGLDEAGLRKIADLGTSIIRWGMVPRSKNDRPGGD